MTQYKTFEPTYVCTKTRMSSLRFIPPLLLRNCQFGGNPQQQSQQYFFKTESTESESHSLEIYILSDSQVKFDPN